MLFRSEATKRNLLSSRLLDADQWAWLRIGSLALVGRPGNLKVHATTQVAGNNARIQFPASIRREDDGLVVTADFEVDQTSLGLRPFSAMGGALVVENRMRVLVHLVARRDPTAELGGTCSNPA